MAATSATSLGGPFCLVSDQRKWILHVETQTEHSVIVPIFERLPQEFVGRNQLGHFFGGEVVKVISACWPG
jgi:hypothetical protein